MRAEVGSENGPASSPHALHYESYYPKPPTLKEGHALIQNHYSGINFIDTYHRQRLYPRNLPFVDRQEGGGTGVSSMQNDDEQCQQQEDGFQIGDRVVYSCPES